MRILFTGGSGKAARHAVEHLVECGHQVTNADLVPARIPDVPDLTVDLTDAGQVFNALSAYARHEELEPGTGVPRYDAAARLGISKVVFASSETTYGVCFADGEVRPAYVPVDEAHPTRCSTCRTTTRRWTSRAPTCTSGSMRVCRKRRELGEYEPFYANDKAKRLVGFDPQHSWREIVATTR